MFPEMPSLSRSKKAKGEEDLEPQVKDLLREIMGLRSYRPPQGVGSIEQVRQWCLLVHETLEASQSREKKVAEREKLVKERRTEIDMMVTGWHGLNADLEKAKNETQREKESYSELYTSFTKMAHEHEWKVNHRQKEHDENMQRIRAERDSAKSSVQSLESSLADLRAEHSKKEAEWLKAKQDLEAKNKEYLLINTAIDNTRNPITDDVMKQKFLEIDQTIMQLTDESNLPIISTDFLEQAGSLRGPGQLSSQDRMRSGVWSILVNGVFSDNHGTQALGKQSLLEEFKQLVVGGQKSLPNGGAISRTYNRGDAESEDIGKWHSMTLQLLQSQVNQQGKATEAQRIFDANVERMANDILELFQHACGGPSRVPEIIRSHVLTLARDSGHLALDMGTQRSRIYVVLPPPGSMVRVDEQFSGSPQVADAECSVELTLCPALRRDGGRSGGSRVVAKGEVRFAAQT